MKVLYNKKGHRHEGGGQSFAFFIIGAVVVLIAVFLVGIYFGRELEKGGGAAADSRIYKIGGEAARPEWSPGGSAAVDRGSDNVTRDLGTFSEDAVRVPVVPPAQAEAVPPPGEESLTFQETLSKKEADTVPLEKPKAKAGQGKGKEVAVESGVSIQAGAFKDRGKAESRLEAMRKAGYSVRLGRSGKNGKEGLHLVIAGPFPDRESARGAILKLKSELKIDAILVNG